VVNGQHRNSQVAAKCVTYSFLFHYFFVTMSRMAKIKVSTLNLRIEPGIKEAVREAAAREHRSVANMVEMLIRRHCDQSGISIPEQNDFFPGTSNG
jgi:hypothetical protein